MQQVRTSSDGNNNFEIARFAICPDNNGIYSEPQDLSHKPIENQNCEMNKQNEDKESFSAYPGKNAHSVCNVNDKFTEQDVLGAGNSQKMTLLGKRTLSDESSESNSFPAMSGYNIEDAEELEMLESFAKEFKQKRIKMNFTQGDVGAAMGKLYGNDFSQTTISRFEALNLSCKNMVKLKPLLERWLIDANRAVYKCQKGEPLILSTAIPLDPNLPPRKKRKKRTSIDPKQKEKLDKIFIQNPRPSSEALLSIAENCQMEKEVVRVWFCNRRQKAKRMQDSTVGEDETSSPGSPYTATISPESHHYLQQSNSTQLSITSGSSNKSTPGSSESTSSFLKSKTEQDSTTAAVAANDWTCNKPASSTSMMHSSRHLNSSLNTLVSNMNGLSAVVDNRQPPSEHTDSSKAAAYGNYNLARAALSSTPVGNHFSPLQTHMFLPNASSELNHSILLSKAAASVDRVPPAVSALSGKPPLLLDAQHPQNQQSNANSNDMSVRSLFLNSQSAVVQNELFPASMVESSVAGSSPLMATVGASQSHTFAAFSKYAAAAAAARNILSNSPCAQPQLLSSDPKSDMALANGVAYPFLLPGQRQNDS